MGYLENSFYVLKISSNPRNYPNNILEKFERCFIETQEGTLRLW